MYRFFLYFLCQLLLLKALGKGKVIQHIISADAEVTVYIPAGYDTIHTYPTIYFNDGETIFAPGYGWMLNNKLDELIDKKIIEPVIIVAIDSKSNRLSWYNPYDDDWIKKNWGSYTPQAKEYTWLISEIIIPFIEKKYSVKKQASARGIIGYSMGGLHATWAGLTHASVFGFSAALSPSYWVADNAILNEINTRQQGGRFWFDLGTAEWQYYIPVYKKLQQAGYKAGIDCFYYEVKDAGHNATDWIQRIHYPLIAFAGINKGLSPQKMEVEFECIPSLAVAGKIFRRVNAVITLENGIKYSLSNTASYTLLEGDIKLHDDGTIIAGTKTKAEIEVTYGMFNKRISFVIDDCSKN
jgi:enterochelin esterase-like enzyme